LAFSLVIYRQAEGRRMSEVRHWLRAVAVAHAAGAATWTANGVAVQRVAGGANNALYRLAVDGQRYACKLCVADERRRATREQLWSQYHGPDRLRLTPFTADPVELYARLVRFIERAEYLAES
jgi:hypothetical protein